MLQPDQVTDPLHAYQLAKRGNSLRVMAEAVRLTKRGARVNTISPGIIFTSLARDELTGPRGEGYRRMIELSPAGRGGTPDEVGTVAALLMGPDGAFITGSDFLMDGGVTASYFYIRPSCGAPCSTNPPSSRCCPTEARSRRASSPWSRTGWPGVGRGPRWRRSPPPCSARRTGTATTPPIGRILANAATFFSRMTIAGRYLPDPEALGASTTPIVPMVGPDNRDSFWDAIAWWIAERAHSEVVEIPGFHAGDVTDPVPFVEILRPILRKLS